MMEYTNKYWNMLMPFIKKSLNKRYGKAYTKALIPKADAEYRDMLNRSDDIGRDNPMASNTYECLVFLAIWKAADGKISVEDLRAISKDVLSTPIMKVMGILINANKASGIKRIQKMMERDAKWLDEHPQYKKYSWDFHFDEKKHKDGIKDWNSFIQTINGLTWSLARELGPSNIRVNAVAPGITKTDMVAALPEQVIAPLIKMIPLKLF